MTVNHPYIFNRLLIILILIVTFIDVSAQKAPAPLFRDPIYDGAADPVITWNNVEKNWWILYTARRANQDANDVAFCYGTPIGVASSEDHGQTWVFRGYLDLNFEKGWNTFWAPDIIYYKGEYHLFVAYIRGVYNHWGGNAHIVHYTSKNLWDWKYEGPLALNSNKVIDPAVFKIANGKFRMWFKDETRGSNIMMAQSEDLYTWILEKKPIIGGSQEGPVVFKFKGYYWMLTDEWHGLRVYCSKDLNNWAKQGLILDTPSSRLEDTPSGAHADVQVLGDKAYIFYFTHPGRKTHIVEGERNADGALPYHKRRSSLQVGELEFKDGTLVCDHDKHFYFYLPDLNW